MKLISDSIFPERIQSVVSSPGLNILVIDDDPLLQSLLSQSFAPCLHVISALSGREGLDWMANSGCRIQCVLLDYQLPGKDGVTVLKEIRELDSEIPVIFMTGFGDLNLVKKALQLGANEYFPKPALPHALFDAVLKWVPEIELPRGRWSHQSSPPEAENSDRNWFRGSRRGGKSLEGRIVRFGSRSVVIEGEKNLSEMVEPQDFSLTNIEMTLGRFSLEVETAEVLPERMLGERFVEIGLPAHWHVESEMGEPAISPSNVGGMPQALSTSVNDLADLLGDIDDDLDSLELDSQGSDRASLEQAFITDVKRDYFPAIDTAVARFESEASRLSKTGFGKTASQIRDVLYPMVLASPFMARVIEKPIGVPGDFGMLGQILGDPFAGHSFYARALNGWILQTGAADAYRYRVDLLNHHLEKTVLQANQNGRRARVLSIGSGVGYEVQRYIRDFGDTRVDFELFDFSTETLREAHRLMGLCVADAKAQEITVKLNQGSVLDLINGSRKGESEYRGVGGFDFVYCTGLFDYLSDRLCGEVVNYLVRLAKTGGKIMVSNFTPQNPIRWFMDIVLDWQLIYRDAGAFEQILGQTNPFSTFVEPSGVEVYGIIQSQ